MKVGVADVIQFADHRRRAPEEKPTVDQLARQCSEEIAQNWERFARNNRLNDFFVQSVPAWTESSIDYISDLNALANIEKKINLWPCISASPRQVGWVAAFHLNNVVVVTPPMFTETYARCFNILLFLKLGREMTQAGISIN